MRVTNDTCDECDGQCIMSGGFLVCAECGCCAGAHIDLNAEWRCFVDERGRDTNAVRCGDAPNPLFPNVQVSTYVSSLDRRSQPRPQWNAFSTKERNVHEMLKEMEVIAEQHGLPRDVVLSSMQLFRRWQDKRETSNHGATRCSVRLGIKAACMYFACRGSSQPREKKEVAKMFSISAKIITKGCRTFEQIMGSEFSSLDILPPTCFVTRFCNNLGMSPDDRKHVLAMVERISTMNGTCDATPSNLVAGCIYYTSQKHAMGFTKAQVSQACDISAVVITKMQANLSRLDDESSESSKDGKDHLVLVDDETHFAHP